MGAYAQQLAVVFNDERLQKYGYELVPVIIDQCACGRLNIDIDFSEDTLPCRGCERPLKREFEVACLQSFANVKIALEYIAETQRAVVLAHRGYPQCALVDLDTFNKVLLPYEKTVWAKSGLEKPAPANAYAVDRNDVIWRHKTMPADFERLPISFQHAPVAAKLDTHILTMNRKDVAAMVNLDTYYRAVLLGEKEFVI